MNSHKGLVVPLERSNVDTDAIIPKQFLKSIRRTGYGQFIFDEWRYLDRGEPGMDCTHRPKNMDFSLNQDRYQGASILLAGENFGCGSSREHAPWGLSEYGFKVIIAPSFADIFYQNASKSQILCIHLDAEKVQALFAKVHATPGFTLSVDLESQTIEGTDVTLPFEIDPGIKNRILHDLDDIAMTLSHTKAIQLFESKRRQEQPWLFDRLQKEPQS